MVQQLQNLIEIIKNHVQLSESEKVSIITQLKEVDKIITITEFKLDRTEKVKRTTAILLEETIEELEQKSKAIEQSNAALTASLKELKAAQAQLIQSEKMASLGELTAGIAHEIQNPLNFVNNFSEVNIELSEEIREAIENGDLEEIRLLATDIKSNQEKIREHGKRADSIVKGMLLHSRSSVGEKEPTDINTLVDEYFRLAYHGIRAKDISFNARLDTVFDESVGLVSIIPQDIGRVVLNLFTNAFYAVSERQKAQVAGYEPIVSVQTEKSVNIVRVIVRDNGSGIPAAVRDKIFQPFFTTKPTGQGTGLGLSLSYDIVKAHGGELKVDTRENEGSVFTVELPL